MKKFYVKLLIYYEHGVSKIGSAEELIIDGLELEVDNYKDAIVEYIMEVMHGFVMENTKHHYAVMEAGEEAPHLAIFECKKDKTGELICVIQ